MNGLAAKGDLFEADAVNGTASRPFKVYVTEKQVIKVQEEWCKGCEICVQVCRKKCLAMNGLGKVMVVNLLACNKCLLCELLCPDFAIVVE
jgi:Pyruvate/2-oxoacid:ferredoxin oxidoreductase delta subunit